MVYSKLSISSDDSSLYWVEFNKERILAMMFKQTALLSLVLFVTACGGGSENHDAEIKPDPEVAGCGGSAPYKFDITAVDVQVLQAPEPKAYPQRVAGPVFDVDADTQYDEIILSLESETQSVVANKSELHNTKKKQLTFSLFNSAFACSPLPPSTDERITELKITSSSPFNDELAAGVMLNAKFDVIFTHSETPYYDYDSINSGIIYYSLEKYMDQEDVVAGFGIQLKLNVAPQYAGNHIFFIEMTLDSGEVFNMETPGISLVKAL